MPTPPVPVTREDILGRALLTAVNSGNTALAAGDATREALQAIVDAMHEVLEAMHEVLEATPGAIAALKTLEGRQTDLEILSLHGIVAAKAEGQLPTSASAIVHRAVLTALRLRPTPSLP